MMSVTPSLKNFRPPQGPRAPIWVWRHEEGEKRIAQHANPFVMVTPHDWVDEQNLLEQCIREHLDGKVRCWVQQYAEPDWHQYLIDPDFRGE